MSTPIHALLLSDFKEAIIREPLIVTPETTVMEAIMEMSKAHSHCDTSKVIDQQRTKFILNSRSSCVLVLEVEKVVGIMTERDVVRLSVEQQSLENLMMRQVMVNPVITMRESQFTDIFSAINLIQQYKIRHLPILDEQDHLVGLVTHETLQNITRPIDLLQLRLVREVMVREVVCAGLTASMLDIAQQMTLYKVSSVIIIKSSSIQSSSQNAVVSELFNNAPLNSKEKEDSKRIHPSVSEAETLTIPVGIVTERDLVQFKALDLNLEQYSVSRLMSTPIFSVQSDESLWAVQKLMQQHFIHRVVVTGEEGKLLGIVTQTSILQALNPLELYKLAEVLEAKVERLEAEKVALLQRRTQELESEIAQRIILEDSLRRATKKLEQLSQTDDLTKISNRRRFDQILQQEWKRMQREQLPISLIFFDVDYFKDYNDFYGHPRGDECLVKLAQATQRVVHRSTDLVARYGGEEFVILLPNTDETGAICIAKRLQQEIAALAIPHQQSKISEVVTVSIGISTIVPTEQLQSQSDAQSPKILVTQADESLYTAKSQGRNSYVVYSEI